MHSPSKSYNEDFRDISNRIKNWEMSEDVNNVGQSSSVKYQTHILIKSKIIFYNVMCSLFCLYSGIYHTYSLKIFQISYHMHACLFLTLLSLIEKDKAGAL